MEHQRIYGLNNEKEIAKYLNGKTITELNDKWKEHIKYMFKNFDEKNVIKACSYCDKNAKPDIVIEINGIKKYVSIKTGKNPSIHHESYCSFKRFLESLGVERRTLRIIQFFHYGDSKKACPNGIPLTTRELKEKYMKYFIQASETLDETPIIRKIIRRTVIQGTNPTNQAIDFLYYGDLEHGRLLSLNDIYSFVLAYRRHDKSPIHFGCLNYNPNSRNPYDRERNYVRIRWPLLSFLYYINDEDFEKIKVGTF